MIATIRVYNETHSLPGSINPVQVAADWVELKNNGWGTTVGEIKRNWLEAHNERLVEVASLDELVKE